MPSYVSMVSGLLLLLGVVAVLQSMIFIGNVADYQRKVGSPSLGGRLDLLASLPSEPAHTDPGGKDDETKNPPPLLRSTGHLVVDLLSVGTLERPEYLDQQEKTLGTHRSVRNFFKVNELNDTETNCARDLTPDRLDQFVQHCATHMDEYPTLKLLKKHFSKNVRSQWLLKMNHPSGWLCAQKRPLDGLHAVLMNYRRQLEEARPHDPSAPQVLPDYLFIMDDDTWIHLDSVLSFSQVQYPSDEPLVVAGCLHREDIDVLNFTFPWGGYSSLLTRSALQKLLHPVYCTNYTTRNSSMAASSNIRRRAVMMEKDVLDDDFERHVCGRLERNQVGEKQFFQDGMSVADIMFAYSSQQPYVDSSRWRSPGFCMHSDVALAYFINFYNIPSHSGDPTFLHTPEDRYRGFNGSILYHGSSSKYGPGIVRESNFECKHNSDENCPEDAHFCHHITPGHMEKLQQ